MKRVIFICLLSLSACLSDQSIPQDGKPAVENAANKASVDPKAQTKEVPDASKTLSEVSSNVPTQSESASPVQASPPQGSLPQGLPPQGSPPVQNSPTTQTITEQTNSNTITSPVTDLKSNTNKTEDNKTSDKLPEGKPSEEKIIKPVIDEHKNETHTKTSTETSNNFGNNTTIIEDKGKTDANSTKNEIQKPTPLQARGFDGPSFIGGIILTLGLIAISFMGYKYYKNHTERNYYGTL